MSEQLLSEDKVREQLKQVIDPELFVNIVDLGLVYVVDITPNAEDASKSDVLVEMTMTSPMCPAGPQLVGNSRQVVEAMENIGKVEIKVVMDPPWTQDMMTEDARDQLGIF
jgi:metal-sulfur cluster biosynthetic enzyme